MSVRSFLNRAAEMYFNAREVIDPLAKGDLATAGKKAVSLLTGHTPTGLVYSTLGPDLGHLVMSLLPSGSQVGRQFDDLNQPGVL